MVKMTTTKLRFENKQCVRACVSNGLYTKIRVMRITV